MLKEKLIEKFNFFKIEILIVFLTLFFYFITSFDSYYDVINPDSINWHARSYLFIKALNSGNYSSTYESYHPGITLMWLLGPSLYSDGNFYTKDNFLEKDYLAKQVIYIFISLNFLISLLLLKNFLKTPVLLLFAFIFTLEPFFLGVRRLVHLEFLMTNLLFNSFLFLILYSLKSKKAVHLILSSLFFVLAFYTKSSAIVLAPILLLIFLFSKQQFKFKLIDFLIVIFSGVLFLYILFPALWRNPINNSVTNFTKIYLGATQIGVEGKREVGTSGFGDNRVLKKSYSKVSDFYFNSFLYTSSPALIILFISVLPLLIYIFINYKNKNNFKFFKLIKDLLQQDNFIVIIFCILSFSIYFVSYSYSVKSFERYGIILLPFLMLFIACVLNSINLKIVYFFIFFYLIAIFFELKRVHPYYYAYGNSLLGGSFARYEKLNSPPFGVGIFELNTKLTEYVKNEKSEYFPVIAGSKTLKAIFKDGRNERYPLCDVDYFVQFYDDKTPKEVCIGKSFKPIFSVNIGNIEYWRVYKSAKQSSKAKKISDLNNKDQESKDLPESIEE